MDVIISFAEVVFDSNVQLVKLGFKDPKFESIKSATARVYYDLRMECINPSCDKVLIPSDYKYHDDNCEITFDTCKDCGFKVHHEKCPVTFDTCKDCDFKARRGSKSDHFCVEVLKGDEELFIERKEVEKGPEEPSWVDAIWVLIFFIVFITLIVLGAYLEQSEENRKENNVIEGVKKEMEILLKNERESLEHLVLLTQERKRKSRTFDTNECSS